MLFRETVSKSTFELLKNLLKNPALDRMALAGGTALSLQLGHRISYDLYFFGTISKNQIENEVIPLYSANEIYSSKSINSFIIEETKVDFVNYSYPLLKELVSIDGLRLYAIEDIAAMKLEAIKGRGRKRNFYDLYCLLKTLLFVSDN